MATYGDVTGEYLALRGEAGLIAGAHDLVWVLGTDAVVFLDGLLSQSIGTIPTGGAAPSLLLSPQGKLRATLWVLRGDNRIGLIADAGFGRSVLEDLTRFKLRVDVELLAENRPVVDVWGPEAGEALASMGLEIPVSVGWTEVEGSAVALLRHTHAALPRFVVIGIEVDDLVDAGIREIGSLASTAVRIEAGEPVMGVDIDDRTIPQEAGIVETTVDFSKGCYLGQELVARIDSRGRVNRHLRGLLMSESVLPPVGAEVSVGDKPIGALSSVAESLELRAPIALALLRREAEPGDEVDIRWEGGSTTARVAELPLDETL